MKMASPWKRSILRKATGAQRRKVTPSWRVTMRMLAKEGKRGRTATVPQGTRDNVRREGTNPRTRCWDILINIHIYIGSRTFPTLIFALCCCMRVAVSTFTDCAVCDTDYSPSLAHTCTECSSSRRQRLMAATAIAAIVAVLAIVAIFQYMVSTDLQHRTTRCFHSKVLRAVPVQSLKIIVVVWQILTQVCTLLKHSRLYCTVGGNLVSIEVARYGTLGEWTGAQKQI